MNRLRGRGIRHASTFVALLALAGCNAILGVSDGTPRKSNASGGSAGASGGGTSGMAGAAGIGGGLGIGSGGTTGADGGNTDGGPGGAGGAPTCGPTAHVSEIGSLLQARWDHLAARLPDGRILIVGGQPVASGQRTASSELVDPGTGQAAPSGNLATARCRATIDVTAKGSLLVVGGDGPNSGYLSSTEQYDLSTAQWSAGPVLAQNRGYHAHARLSDGRIMVAGGIADNTHVIASAELLTGGAWLTVSPLLHPRSYFRMTTLDDGRVLATGGYDGSDWWVQTAPTVLSSAELFDPATSQWTAASPMTAPRREHTATLLQDGTVLIAGGVNQSGALKSAERFDPKTATFTPVGSMHDAHAYGTATLLPDGHVLVAGGLGTGLAAVATTDIFDPATNTFQAGPALEHARWGHTATLADGCSVLIVGGMSGNNVLASIERVSFGP